MDEEYQYEEKDLQQEHRKLIKVQEKETSLVHDIVQDEIPCEWWNDLRLVYPQ